jgi:hypothetical protein
MSLCSWPDSRTGQPEVSKCLSAAAETQILSTECEIYLTVLIKSLEQDFPLWHRIFVLEVLRTLCGDGALLRFLWDNYDGLGTTKVVRDLAVVLARHVHSAMQVSVLRPYASRRLAAEFRVGRENNSGVACKGLASQRKGG